jgi:chromosome segregation protein
MYLSKLEILGFKSFADKINLNFKDGLSAIVGPNGSGKTNFVDALRWVLGEQKTSVLRSELMENVIFSGSKNRKPLGLAEVSITIKNTKKILPSEYDEINISRRLYRDGESQYLINKVPARLKDITGLFMDTGLGADSYSVIELKMIENLLNGNTADRRDIFEEAAGIKKFKQNKKETTKKLQNVELDLERLNDIFQEVQKNVNSLARQAAKTRRYNSIISELKDLEIKLYAFELLSFNAKLKSKHAEAEIALKKTDEIYHSISETEKFLNELKVEFNTIDNNYQLIAKTELELNNKLSLLNTEISLNEEKINSLEVNQTSIKNEIEESKKFLLISENNLKQLNSEIAELKDKEAGFNSNFQIVQLDGKNIQFRFHEQEKKVAQINSFINDLKNKLTYNNSLISRNTQTKLRTEQKIQEEELRLKSLDQQLHDSIKLMEIKQSEFEEYKEKTTNAKVELEKLLAQKVDSEKLIETLKNEEFESKNILNKLTSEKNFLESIVVSDESTKYLLKSKNWFPNDEKVLLGEIISIEDKYKKALYSALNLAISSFLVNSISEAEKGISELKASKQGIAHFVLNEKSTSNIDGSKNAITSVQGFIGLLSDFVSVNEEYKHIVQSLTNNIFLAEDFDSAKEIVNSLKKNYPQAKFKVVTLSGEVIDEFGIISGGGEAVNQKTQLLGRRNRIKLLDSEITKISSKISELQDLMKSEQSKILNLAIPEMENSLRSLEQSTASIERERNQSEIKIESFKNNYNLIEESIKKMHQETDELINEDSSFAKDITEISSSISQNQLILETEQNLFNELRKQLGDWSEQSKQAEIELVRIQSEIRYKEIDIKNIENSIEVNKLKISEKEKEFEMNKVTKQNLSEKISQGLRSKQEIIENLQDTLSEKESASHNRKSILDRVSNYEFTLDNFRKNFAKNSDESHAIELEIASINSRVESLQEVTLEQYKLNLNEFIEKNQFTEEERTNFDISSAKTDIALLKEKISLLGNVNFQALEDFDEQKARLDFLLTQLTDLQNSQKLLAETIEEINKIAIEKFLTTFNEIRTNFKNLFKVLFGAEGEADLILEGDSPLEASIGITAKPPFKKPSSIDLLSAGEKTLTAIALLFSIYLVKPSPFCILDEVDAPLDDSNIDKFIALIRKFSLERSIQYILITHNKKTMEAADTLYGLTMEEEGVTKVVSVRLEK